jgi:alkanesulfonate monooxygenase SsuD/methylene tetrahydromethanopterin reductase-like flavin-dependent oxidoreductase (luciferase family)
MARMKPQGAVSIHYDEVRYLELLDKPWHGSGFLYALPPDKMIKEQWKPNREIMGADGKRLYYYDPSNDVRRSTEMRANDPAAAHVDAFRALLNGNRELIDSLYRVEFLSTPERWQLTLTSKTAEIGATLAKIVISGLPEKPADKIEIHQADGDRSKLALLPEPASESLHAKVNALYKELQGAN